MDSCVGKVLTRQMIIGGKQTYGVLDLIEQVRYIANTLRNEYLLRDPRGFPESIYHRISMLQQSGELTIQKD